MTRNLLAGVMLLTISGGVAATHSNARGSNSPECRVQGVWKLVRVTVNGTRPDTTSFQQRKIMTKNHFMWVNQDARRDTLPLKTYRDTVRRLNNAGGSGTYRVSGSTLIEHIDLFPDPTWAGRDWRATCETDANRWLHTWISDPYTDSTGRSRRDTVAETYRREE